MTFPSRDRRGLCARLLVLAGSLALGCGGPSTVEPPERVQRIVLVTIDTLRADHVGSFGYPRDVTPFLDELAAGGVSFRRAYAQSATTGPSHTSMFTGLYPLQHRVINNGHKLADSYVTLAEALRERGFRTAAFVGTNAHFKWAALSQGFDVYDEQPMEGRAAQVRKLYRPADETMERVLAWLEGVDPSERVFLWVHLYDPHRPLGPPLEYVQRVDYIGEEARQRFLEFLRTEHRLDIDPESKLFREILEYDAEILFVDTELRRLHEEMAGAGLAQDTMWVVTSDHGQGLGNHDWFGHAKYLYQEQLHVPLIFRFGDRSTPLVVDDRVVEHVDLTPTILDIVDGSRIEQQFPVQGQSLVPLMTGDGDAYTKRYALAQRSRYDPRHSDRPNYEPGDRFALQDLRWKYILFTEGPDEMYDLRADPYEQNDLLGTGKAPENRYLEVLLEMIQRLTNEAPPEMVDESTLERLRALGYIQ